MKKHGSVRDVFKQTHPKATQLLYRKRQEMQGPTPSCSSCETGYFLCQKSLVDIDLDRNHQMLLAFRQKAPKSDVQPFFCRFCGVFFLRIPEKLVFPHHTSAKRTSLLTAIERCGHPCCGDHPLIVLSASCCASKKILTPQIFGVAVFFRPIYGI